VILKVGNEYLDFDDSIEVEKQIKLFEDISTTDGDFSYAFDLPKTIHNTQVLQNPFPDNISKPVYQQIQATLLSDGGAKLYKGYLRIERITSVYECSFFAGNNNWFARITGLLTDIDLSIYDIDNNEVNIIDSWSLKEGLVFPFLDNGSLITRSYHQLKIEDFVAGLYVKTIFSRVFAEAGIKIKGELLEDWRYNNMICVSNSKDQGLIDDRTSYVEKNIAQVVPANTEVLVTWDNDSTAPFFDGSANLFNLAAGQYDPDLKMTVQVDVTLVATSGEDFGLMVLIIYINGVLIRSKPAGISTNTGETPISINASFQLNPGDEVEIRFEQANVDSDPITIERGTIKITPTYIYRTIGSAAVPNWTQQQFVSNILRIFNVLAYYNAGDSELTLNLFEKIKSKTPLDLSEHISDTEVDYSEFISDYGRRSRFSYKEVDFEELKAYNQGKYFKYGQGFISVNNDFLENDKSILESDFANPVDYLNAVFDASMGKTNLIELNEGEEFPFSNVGDDGFGDAAFNVGSTSGFLVGDLVRVSDSTVPGYNGDWIVKTLDGVHVVFNGLPFDTGATGNLTRLNYKYSSSEDVFIFINIPNYPRARFSDAPIVFDSGSFYPIEFTNIALAYFDMINTGKEVNSDFIYSLSFGGIDDPLHYMVTMIDSYFSLFSKMLNDPVKLISTAQLPYAIYNQIDFLSPITIKTLETQNQYYLNRITGYKESYLDSTLELIKLPGNLNRGTRFTTGQSIDIVEQDGAALDAELDAVL
jgi:hypothetical protein